MKSHLTKHVQDLYNLSIQYYDLKLLFYSNIGVVLGNTLINIVRNRYQNVVIYLLIFIVLLIKIKMFRDF